MPAIDRSHPRGECESCRALHVWREKSRDLEKRLEIAEKAALACPKPLVWTVLPPKVPGWYFMQVRLAGEAFARSACTSRPGYAPSGNIGNALRVAR